MNKKMVKMNYFESMGKEKYYNRMKTGGYKYFKIKSDTKTKYEYMEVNQFEL